LHVATFNDDRPLGTPYKGSQGSLLWVRFSTPFFVPRRRTHSSLANAKGIDPKLVADQQGHGVDVNLNVYTQTSLANRLEAVEEIAAAFVN
jgi:hypothetical protein